MMTLSRMLAPALAVLLGTGTADSIAAEVGTSPWGPDDQIGRLNLMTAESRAAVLGRVAGGVLIDVAVAKGVDVLPDGYRVSRADLVEALNRQEVELRRGDVVLIRTGRMQRYEDAAACMVDPPGMGRSAARVLIEEGGAMIVGADNLSFEAFPSEVKGNYGPVHTYLLAQQGAPIVELGYLEDLAKDGVFEFAFIGGSLILRGADGAPVRPIALPLRQEEPGGAS